MKASIRVAALPKAVLPLCTRFLYFVGIALLECRALERPELRANADGVQRVDDGLAGNRGRGIDDVVTGIQPVRISGLGQELLGASGIVPRRRRRPEGVEGGGNDGVRE